MFLFAHFDQLDVLIGIEYVDMSFGGKLICEYLKNQCALRNLNEKVL